MWGVLEEELEGGDSEFSLMVMLCEEVAELGLGMDLLLFFEGRGWWWGLEELLDGELEGGLVYPFFEGQLSDSGVLGEVFEDE